MSKKIVLAVAATAAVSGAIATTSTDTDFSAVVAMLSNWSQGSLGKSFALAAFVIGIAAGVTQQSVMAAVIGISVGLVMTYGPNVINGVFGALV